MSNCIEFVSILNPSYFIKKEKKHMVNCNWWNIKWNTKSRIKDLYSTREYHFLPDHTKLLECYFIYIYSHKLSLLLWQIPFESPLGWYSFRQNFKGLFL